MKITILYTDTTRTIEPKEMLFIHDKWDMSNVTDDVTKFYKFVEYGYIVNIVITRLE